MVLTRSGVRVDFTDKSTPIKTPRVQVTFSTDQTTTETLKPEDDSTHHAPVETCDNSDEGASSSSAVSSKRICSTPSRPIVQSEVDSCSSSVSCTSSRRTTRSRQYCDTPVPSVSHRITRSQQKMSLALSRAKAACEQSVSSSENSNASDTDCSSRRSMRSRKKLELTDVHSPIGSLSSAHDEGTPCSSRTGSGYSSCGAPSTRSSVRSVTVIEAVEAVKEDEASKDSSSDCTLIQTSEGVVVDLTSADADAEKMETVASEESPACTKKVVIELVMLKEDQQVEPPAEYEDEDTSEIKMKKLVLSGEPSEPPQSVRVTICEEASETPVDEEEKQQDEDVADVEALTSQSVGPLPEAEGVEIHPCVEISTSTGDSQKVVELQLDSVDVTPDQQHDAVAESAPKKTKVISLLDCSDEDEESDDEEEEHMEVPEEKEKRKSTNVSAVSVEGLFMIDTRPGSDVDVQYHQEEREGEEAGTSKGVEEEDKFEDEEGDDDDDENALVLLSRRDSHLKDLSSSIDAGIKVKDVGRLYISFDGSSSKPGGSSSQKQKEKKIQDDVMKKSVIGPDFEKKDAVPPYSESKQALKLKRKAERAKSTGEAWFNMKAPELTPELKKDLQVLKMRGALDSKRFYKKNDRDGFPKYFQVGSVVDSPVDYHSRVPRKERKRTMVEELLADAEFRQNNKKKYQHIVSERAASSKRSKKMNR